MLSKSLDCRSNCGSNAVGTSRIAPARMHLDCRRNQFRYFGTKRTQQECTSNVVEIFRLQLECRSNASLLPSESISIFSVAARMRLECSWNVPTRMQECPECTSNSFRLPSESLDCPSKCASNAVGMSRTGCKNVPNAPRMHLDCHRNLSIGARMRLECSWNVPTRMKECPECTSNASRMPSESLDCRSNAVGTSRLGFKNARRMHLECISIAVGIYFDHFRYKKKPTRMHFECCRRNLSIAARMRLEYSWNVPTKMQECIPMPPESILIFSVLKEPNSNALQMHLDCRGNPFRYFWY